MSGCERIRPHLGRAVEGEASPAGALELARHLSGCTACRILLARERRLLALLDGLEDPLPPDDGLIERLRRLLPARSAIRAGREAIRSRRGLRLVGALVGIGAAGYGASRAAGWQWNGLGSPWSSPPGPEGADALLRGLAATFRFLLGVAEQVASPSSLAVGDLELPVWVVAAGLAGAAAACAAAGLAMVARALPPPRGGGGASLLWRAAPPGRARASSPRHPGRTAPR